tara:strand:+ start:604 stop:2934 length:2331 start_codon:yes stop_codon:yes gene_type:complete
MALQFLTGLSIDGNIDLNSNQIKEVRIDNLSSAPTGSLGRIYYDDTTDKLRLYNGGWVDLQTGTDGNTTYDLTVPSGTTAIRLVGSDGTNDNVTISGTGLVSVSRIGATELRVATTATSNVGTVTSVSGGDGISITGGGSVTPTVNVDYVGSDNAILVARSATPIKEDQIWFSDATDSEIKRATISALPGFGKDGTVTSVGAGDGLVISSGVGTVNPTLAVDYAGTDNIILSATDGASTPITVASTDKIILSDATDNGVKFVNIAQITAAIGGGTVQTVSGASTVSGITLTSDDDTVDPILTLAGTVGPTSGGTGQTVYTVGDMLYAGATTRLDKLGIGSAGQVLKVVSGAPAWAADSNSGGTVTSITPAADSGTGTAITSSGTLTLSSSNALITTSIAGTTWKINTTATDNVGTVTSVVAGAGMTQSGTSTVNPTLNVVPAVGGGISVAANSVSVDGTVVRTTGAQSIAGTKTFSSNIVVPTTPSIGTNAASKSYVDSTFAGSGALIFQGGYNAATNTPDLDSTPSAAIKQGWTYAVTAAGQFFAETVEDGDLLIAESDSPTALSDWTVVQNNIGIATAGSTDGGTTKGIAGFDSANFTVSANGWAGIKAGGISDSELASTFNKIIGIDTDINTSGVEVVDQISLTDGVVQTLTKRTLPDASVGARGVAETATQAEVDAGTAGAQLMVTPATLKAHIDKQTYTQSFPASSSASTTIGVATHGLGVGPFLIQCYVKATGKQVQLDITVSPTNGNVTLATTSAQATNTLEVVMMKIR